MRSILCLPVVLSSLVLSACGGREHTRAGPGTSGGGASGGASADGSSGTTGGLVATGGGPHSPAELLGGLSAWHLTLPTGPSNSATQIDWPELDTYSDAHFELTDTRDRVRMVDLFGGSRTSTGTAFARTELRQEYAGPDALGNADWPCTSSVHGMHVKQRIVLTPLNKPEMSIGQIHDAANDLLEVRYIGPEDADGIGTGDGKTDTGRIEAHFNNDAAFQILDGGYTIGDLMTLGVSTDGAGSMVARYENVTQGKAQTASAAFYAGVSGGCYFKAGNYHQACTIEDTNGTVNDACKAKSWPSGRFETDPFGESVLELFELTVQ